MALRTVLALVVLALVLPATPRAVAATPQASIHVDVLPTGPGSDPTPPGATNTMSCNADLSHLSETTGPRGWEPSDDDGLNSTSLICATLVDSQGAPLQGQKITMAASGVGVVTDADGPDPSLSQTAAVVGADGYAEFYIFSTKAGTERLDFTGGGAQPVRALQIWDKPGNYNARVIGCAPDTASVGTGSDQTITCTVTDGFGNGVAAVGVTWSAADSGGAASSLSKTTTTTTDKGVVTATVTSSSAGSTTVTATIPASSTECDASASSPDPFDRNKPAGVCSDGSALTWTAAPPGPAGITLSPASVRNPQHTRVTFIATVTDEKGNPAPGVTVKFHARGANVEAADAVTDANGAASFKYVGEKAGDDRITSYVDSNANGTLDTGEPVARATAAWTASCPGYAHDPRTQVVGTKRKDHLHGTVGFDILCGLGGNDVLDGRGGGDVILGGAGDDRIDGADGEDVIYGGPGADHLLGGLGPDELWGQSGNDWVYGGAQVDELHGDGGADHLFGGKGNDDLFGGAGLDSLDGGPQVDFCRERTDGRRGCEK